MSTPGKKMATSTPLAKALSDLGISQATAAFRLGIAQSQLNSYCTGKTRPRADKRERIARYLGMTVTELFG